MSRFHGLTTLVLFPLIVGCGGGGGGSNSVTPVPAAPPTISLTPSSESLELGNSFTLNWSVSNATSCQASGAWEGSKVLSGIESFSPSTEGSYRYSLTCSNSSGNASKEVVVGVNDPNAFFKLKVIDGYIEGANVFVDFNWNLRQDVGEPSARSDGEGNYTFSRGNGEFSAISDVSFECARDRIQIAEVPVGAVDSRRGSVEEAFTMFYVPGGVSLSDGTLDALTKDKINISPFTGLFLDIVSEEKEALSIESITLADGCRGQANRLAESVIAEVDEFVESLQSVYAITLEELYEDYLDSNNTDRANKAEKIVNYLKAANGIKQAIINRHSSSLPVGYAPYVALSKAASDKLFDSKEFDFLEFSVGLYFLGESGSDGWHASESLHATELKLLEDGKILDYGCSSDDLASCTILEPNYENLLNSLKSYVGYGGFKNTQIIDGVTVTSQFREEINNVSDGITKCNSTAQLIFDEPLATCRALGCPATADYQLQINHNIGFSYASQCDEIDNTYIYVLIDQKHTWSDTNSDGNSREIYSIQYSLKSNSAIYSNPPIEFLGENLTTVNYQEVYDTVGNLFLEMDEVEIALLAVLLSENEFISIARTTFDSVGNEKARFDYVVENDSTSCREQSWQDGAGWAVTNLTEGLEAFVACSSFIKSFGF